MDLKIVFIINFLTTVLSYPYYFDCDLKVASGHGASCNAGTEVTQCQKIMSNPVVNSNAMLANLPSEVVAGDTISIDTPELANKGLIGVSAGELLNADSDCSKKNAIRVTPSSSGPSSVKWRASAPSGTEVTFTYAYASGYAAVTRGTKTLTIVDTPSEVSVSTFYPSPDYKGELKATGTVKFTFQSSSATLVEAKLTGVATECRKSVSNGRLLQADACGMVVATIADCSDFGDHFVPAGSSDAWPLPVGNGTFTESIPASAGLTYQNLEQRPLILYDHEGKPFSCSLIGGSSAPTSAPAPEPEEQGGYPWVYFILPIVGETLLLAAVLYCACHEETNSEMQHQMLQDEAPEVDATHIEGEHTRTLVVNSDSPKPQHKQSHTSTISLEGENAATRLMEG